MERTRIITATITIIEKNPKDNTKPSNKVIAEALKKQLKADDVQVSSVKDFMLEGKEEPAKKTTKKKATTTKKEETVKAAPKKPAAKKTTKKEETKPAAPKKKTTKKEAK